MKTSIALIATIILLLTSCGEEKHNKATANTASEAGKVTVPKIIRNTNLPSSGQLIAYIYIGDSPRKKMTSIGSNYKLKLVDLTLGSQYQITIEFVFDSPIHGEVNLATQKKIIKITAGDNSLVFGDAPYTIFDNDNDGKSNIVELADGTYSNIMGSIGWQKAIPVETGNTSWSPQVVVDSSGNAIAVWVKHNGTRSNIWARHFALSTGWDTTKLISVTDWDARSPQIVADSNGNMMAVWDQWDGTRSNIWANRFTFGTGWGKAELIEVDDIDGAWKPQAAADGNGNIIVVWQQSDGIRESIWANRFIPGAGWGGAELIEVDNSGGAWRPQVAMNSSGKAVVVWFQSDGSRENIWVNHYNPSTGWGAAKLIETDNAGNAKHPQVSVDSYGNALVVWQQSDGARFNIWANRFILSSGWGTAELIETDDINDAWYPQVVTDSIGNALVVWYQYDDTYSNIWANRLAFGSDWGTAEIIETNNDGDAISPQLAVDNSGNAVVVWYQHDGERENTWANHFTSGIGWGNAKLIENDNTMRGDSPQVAVDSLGNAVVVWHQFDSTRENIWANHFKVQ